MFRVRMDDSSKGNSFVARFLPTWISAIAVAVSIIFSIFVWRTARSLSKPAERPILSLFFQEAQTIKQEAQKKDIKNSEPKFEVRIQNYLKNIGKNPAKDINYYFAMGPKKNPEAFDKKSTGEIANRIDPDQFFILEKGGDIKPEEVEFFFYLLLTYKDEFSKKNYHDEFFYTYIVGRDAPMLATIEEKKPFDFKIEILKKEILKTELKPGQKNVPFQ